MAGQPEELTNRSWLHQQAVPISDALDSLPTYIEHRLVGHGVPGSEQRTSLDEDLQLPLDTGILEVDRALGGGLRPGT